MDVTVRMVNAELVLLRFSAFPSTRHSKRDSSDTVTDLRAIHNTFDRLPWAPTQFSPPIEKDKNR